MRHIVATTIGLAVAQFGLGSAAAQEGGTIYQIPLKSGVLAPEPTTKSPPAVEALPLELDDPTAAAPTARAEEAPANGDPPVETRATKRMIIQFERLPSTNEIAELRGRGVRLQDYIGGFSYLATGDAAAADSVEQSEDNIRAIQPLLPSQKVHPDLARIGQEEGDGDSAEPATVTVQLFGDADLKLTVDAIRGMDGEVVESSRAARSLVVRPLPLKSVTSRGSMRSSS
ncbi:hypothetical protein ACG873_01445 (plasmid) [Mesorhizobium sp. AaZ16]|uniref:hypothetical protein n=1 Tax=Mesorhizobium sp. AaZ16 TaxID=3402289 RepID=UPI00374F08D7